MKLFPTPHAVALMLATGVVGTNVSTQPAGADDQLPAARVTLLTDTDPTAPWVRATFQIDVWGATDATAGELAWDLAAAYDATAPGPVDDTTHRAGAWVYAWPRPITDSSTPAHRYLFEVGLIIERKEP